MQRSTRNIACPFVEDLWHRLCFVGSWLSSGMHIQVKIWQFLFVLMFGDGLCVELGYALILQYQFCQSQLSLQSPSLLRHLYSKFSTLQMMRLVIFVFSACAWPPTCLWHLYLPTCIPCRSQLAGWSVCRLLVGQLIGWSVGQSVG